MKLKVYGFGFEYTYLLFSPTGLFFKNSIISFALLGKGFLSFHATFKIFSTVSPPQECVTNSFPDLFKSRIKGAITLFTFVLTSEAAL